MDDEWLPFEDEDLEAQVLGLIEHMLVHYVQRDIFRAAASNPLRTAGLEYSRSFVSGVWPDELYVEDYEVEQTRKHLLNLKISTLHYLHQRLHDYPYLNEHEHVHVDGQTFNHVIYEAPEGPFDA